MAEQGRPLLGEQEALSRELAKVFATRPQEEWLDRLLAADVPCAPVATYADVGDPTHTVGRHLRANGYLVEAEHRDFGLLRLPGPPTVFTGTPAGPLAGHKPHIGEHTAEVLRTDLGYSDQEAQELVSSGVVPKPDGPYAEENTRAKRREVGLRRAAELRDLKKAKL